MQYHKDTLPNGLRVITVPIPHSVSVTVFVLTAAGSEFETKTTSGAAHFLEHMCFKGTKKRPTARVIAEEIEGLGGGFNAVTSREHTGYFVRAETRHFSRVLDIVSDVFLNPRFPKGEMEKERGVIIQEIGKYEDDPHDHVFTLSAKGMYGDQPAGRDVLGTRKSVENMKVGDLKRYRTRHYIAPGTVIVVAGNVGRHSVVEKVGKIFSAMPQGVRHKKKKTTYYDGPRVHFESRALKQMHLVLGIPAYSMAHPRRLAAGVLSVMLGGGMSSRLFQNIREEMGAVYDIFAAYQPSGDHGEFLVYAGTDPNGAEEVVRAILYELRRLREEPLREREFTHFKNFLAGNIGIKYETSSALAQFYGGREVRGLPLQTPAEIAEEIHRLTIEEVKAAIDELFRNNRLHLSVIGPPSVSEEKFLSILDVE